MAPLPDVASNKIKLYLVKKKFSSFDSILKKDSETRIRTADLGDVGILYYKDSFARKPDWLKTFFLEHKEIDPSAFSISGASAVLLTKILYKGSERIFAIPFGSGRFILKDNVMESRFGFISTLNILESTGIRSIGKTTLSGNPKMTREQISRASGTTDFEINIENDIVESITGRSLLADFGSTITGKDALSITAKVDISNIKPFLKRSLEIYEKKDYQKDFKWIDYIKEIIDEDLRDSLNTILVDNINEKKTEETWLAVPEIIEWDDFDGFKYSTRKKDELHEDLDINEYLEQKSDADIALGDLEEDVVVYWSSSKDSTLKRWTIYHCLNSFIEYKSNKYLLDKSRWYKLDRSFVSEVEREFKSVKTYPKAFPDYNHDDENAYNVDLCSKLKGFCLDAQNLQFGGGSSKIEVCDILTPEKEFFHIKKYAGSSPLSHLFAQGFVSAELFVTEQKFRSQVREKLLSPPFDDLFPKSRPTASEYSIVYGVITYSKKDKLTLPFFSKVNLKNVKRVLEGYGFNIYLGKILNVKEKKKKPTKKKKAKEEGEV